MDQTREQILIEELAVKLGAKRNAVYQWRFRRHVPHCWRLPILKAAKGKLSEKAFESFGR